MSVKDQAQRLKALEASSSFIVQAPAGSGKTELLTQRFLVLLSTVRQAPEEVVAITFTRKAATEMRARILEALQFAAISEAPTKPHALQTWQLAKEVLARDQLAKWNLLQNPNRLRILTIDALCARIAKSAPLVANFGTVPQVVEDPTTHYIEAAHRLLMSLDEPGPWIQALKTLLLHLDNNYVVAENLFIGMLSRRDQWLANVVRHRGENSREVLEAGLRNVITDTLQKTSLLLTLEEKNEIMALSCFAGSMLKNTEKQSSIANCAGLSQFPNDTIPELPIWLGIAELLLTKAHEWRRAVNKNCGFPAQSEALNQEEEILFRNMKERMNKLLAKLSKNDFLQIALKDILLLPPPSYSNKQWEIVNALTDLLPILVAHLNIIFREHNVTDFIAIAEGAIHALGDSENPSDLALNLDYHIQHLLVDEFQDTSVTQYRLLELLIAGWEKNDGRTLFLVGDPMQSIYRFREAEVGIFLRVKNFGIGNIELIPITLEVNFRSLSPIVNWFNDTFKDIFPHFENIESGAIPFTSSIAFATDNHHLSEVIIHPFLDPKENREAQSVAQLIKKELEIGPKKSIAVLVRSRSHLQSILPELKKAQLTFQAIEIEKLIYSPAVQDLFSLTKALSHTGDQISWLAILRAPWCGLSLTDLYAIVNHNNQATIWENLISFSQIQNLSITAQQSINRIMPVLTYAMNERARGNFRAYIAYTWYSLGGPACLDEEHELKNTEAYFKLLDYFNDRATIDFKLLHKKILRSYSHSASPNANIHLMTIHKAKGLEFDVVIIPALEKRPAVDENQLLLWLERQNSMGLTDLILAPIRSLEDDFDPIYRYVRTQNSLKSYYEICRLLYVAMTRAKSRLHLLGSVYSSEDENKILKDPQGGSFLHLLWPKVKQRFEQNFPSKTVLTETEIRDIAVPLKRLTSEWTLPPVIPQIQTTPLSFSSDLFAWTPDYLHHVGTVIHQILQTISEKNDLINPEVLEESMTVKNWEKKLLQLGVVKHDLPLAINLIQKAILNTLKDERGQWILKSTHLESRSEFPVSIYENNEVMHYVIDRTFVDEKGVRWIIDYKNTEIEYEEKTFLLVRAKLRYANQLEQYARVMKLLDDRPIKLGLYFPLFSGWCEWDYKD